ncbi:hypothetical protein [Acetobacter sacchari]|uniref:hypothetical protein n=1 Tax=Acetobacter sacchari TaxID=2661687 RepID=UPI001FAEF682|nr:hypothetical protein [Acetobacter sacchari]
MHRLNSPTFSRFSLRSGSGLRRSALLPVLAFCLAGLSGCADTESASQPAADAQPPAEAPKRIPPQDFPPGTVAEIPPPEGTKLVNDPSAPNNTPLCGAAAQEANATGASIYPQPLSSGDSCVQNACFDPATLTYIASDGTRRVCR